MWDLITREEREKVGTNTAAPVLTFQSTDASLLTFSQPILAP